MADYDDGCRRANSVNDGANWWSAKTLAKLNAANKNKFDKGDFAQITEADATNKYKVYVFKGNVTGWVFCWTAGSPLGTGDVTGPASATSNAIATYDGTTGKIIKNTLALVNSDGSLNLPIFVAPRVSVDGDAWLEVVAGQLFLSAKVAGVVKSVELN